MMKRTPLDCLLGLYQPSWKTKNTERIIHERNFRTHSKKLESIDAELKARNADRKKLLEEAERIEKKVIEIQAEPFGLENLKAAALADKSKKKE